MATRQPKITKLIKYYKQELGKTTDKRNRFVNIQITELSAKGYKTTMLK